MRRSLLAIFWLAACGFSLAGAAAPIITEVKSQPVEDTWAVVTWKTNQPASSIVEYGLTPALGQTTSNSALVTTHQVQLNLLADETQYYYRVRSVNAASESGQQDGLSFTTKPAVFGAEPNPTGNPIGGGGGYTRTVGRAQASVVVSTRQALLTALQQATAGTIIYIDDAAAIDLTPDQNVSIPAGVTLASGRGINGSEGGVIFTRRFAGTSYLFRTGGAGVRMTGLRLGGPHSWRGRGTDYAYGVVISHAGFEMDNCEMWGWNYSATALSGAAADGANIHHNYIHHCQRNGLGYGITTNAQSAMIEANLFDYMRHAIASTGRPGSGYEARYNVHMENSISHLFDMHGARDYEKYYVKGTWRFDETSGNQATDSSIYASNHGTLMPSTNGPTRVEGVELGALRFDGIDDYVSVPHHADLTPTNYYAVMAWINPANVTGTKAIVSKGTTTATGSGYSLRLVGSSLEATLYSSTGAQRRVTVAGIVANQWQHVAVVFTGSQGRVFINGVLKTTITCSGASQSTLPLMIGRDASAASSYFNGMIDEVRFYNYNYPDADVMRHYMLQSDIAGDTMRIHHNSFRCTDQTAIVIRGRPANGCWVNNNWFHRTTENIRQINGFGNMFIGENLVGLGVDPVSPPSTDGATIHGSWAFDEGSGTTANDASGNTRHGTLVNMNATSSWIAGVSGTALQFTGSSTYVNVSKTLTVSDNIAVEASIRFDTLAEYQYPLDNGMFRIWNRGGWAGNKLYFSVRLPGTARTGDSSWDGWAAVKSTTELQTGRWYHVVGTRRGNTMRIFIDGKLEREFDAMEGYTVNTGALGPLRIGQIPGKIDQVKVFSPVVAPPPPPPTNQPTLTWTGESGYTNGPVQPVTGSVDTLFRFRVTYRDPTNEAPMPGYPRLRLQRNDGAEFRYVSPVTMMAADNKPFNQGRVYVYSYRLPRGSDYLCHFEAKNESGIDATGPATIPVKAFEVVSGNHKPVVYFPDDSGYTDLGMTPASGDSNRNFDYRCRYMDIDGDIPVGGSPRLHILRSGVEIPGSPFTMNPADTITLLEGRKFQLLKRLPQGSYTYYYTADDGNGGLATPTASKSGPTVSSGSTLWTELYHSASEIRRNQTIDVHVSFAQPVINFTAGDVQLTNATISQFSGSGVFFSFKVTATGAGTVGITIPAAAAQTSGGLNNTASATTIPLAKTGSGDWQNYP